MIKNQRLSCSISILFVSMALLIGTGTLFFQQAISQQDDTANSIDVITNQTETTATTQFSNILAINLTGLVNQTDGNLIGFRPVNPLVCELNPDSSVCKEKPDPVLDNKCIGRIGVCDPCNDPAGICPVPKDIVESIIILAPTPQNLTSNVPAVPIREVLQNVTEAINSGNNTRALEILSDAQDSLNKYPESLQYMMCEWCPPTHEEPPPSPRQGED
jgi:hypothetical protein